MSSIEQYIESVEYNNLENAIYIQFKNIGFPAYKFLIEDGSTEMAFHFEGTKFNPLFSNVNYGTRLLINIQIMVLDKDLTISDSELNKPDSISVYYETSDNELHFSTTLTYNVDNIYLINGLLNDNNEIIPPNVSNVIKLNEGSFLSVYLPYLRNVYSEFDISNVTAINIINPKRYNETERRYYVDLILSGKFPIKIYEKLPLSENKFELYVMPDNSPLEPVVISSINKLSIPGIGIDTSGNNASSINLTGITFN